MKEQILTFGSWAEEHWIQIVILAAVVLLGALALVFLSWLIGYWLNALYGMKFELNSCWTGIGSVGTALGIVVGLAKAAWTKYGMDSRYNSPIGKPTEVKK